MTKKEKFMAIAELIDKMLEKDICCSENYDLKELSDFCLEEVDKLNKRNEKAREASRAKREADQLLLLVEDILADAEDYMTIDEMMQELNDCDEDLTSFKVAYRASQLVRMGKAEKQEKTIPSQKGGRSRKVQSYKLI